MSGMNNTKLLFYEEYEQLYKMTVIISLSSSKMHKSVGNLGIENQQNNARW